MNRTPVKAQVHNFETGVTDQILQLNVFLSPQALKQIQRMQEQVTLEQLRQEEILREQQAHYMASQVHQPQETRPYSLDGEDLKAEELIEIKRLLKKMRETGNNKENFPEEQKRPMTRPIQNYTESYIPTNQSHPSTHIGQPIEHTSEYRGPQSRQETYEYTHLYTRPIYNDVHPRPLPESNLRPVDSNRRPQQSNSQQSLHPVAPVSPIAIPDYSRSNYGQSLPPSQRKPNVTQARVSIIMITFNHSRCITPSLIVTNKSKQGRERPIQTRIRVQ